MLKLSITSSVLLGALAIAGTAHAYEAGDMVFRAGVVSVHPDDSSTPLYYGNQELSAAGVGASPTYASVDNSTQLGLTFTYMYTENFGVEVLGATPFSHDIYLSGGLNQRAGETKHLPPTVSAQYYPLGSGSAFQPYAGIGLNYTTFFSEKVDPGLDATLDTLNAGDSSLSLDDSWGVAFEVGFDYQLTEQLLLNAAVWKVDIETTATVSHTGLEDITTDVTIDPYAYMLSIGYKF
ncbi:MAG: OmpW family outer membrane protein [Pseudomonadota bacterium]|nr:OmpW family outer membrane protein [Pseudomonadota bacterium]